MTLATLGGSYAVPYALKAMSAAAPYFGAAKTLLNSVRWESPNMRKYGGSKRIGKKYRKFSKKSRGKYGKNAKTNVITKYHDVKGTYVAKRLRGRKRSKYSFRKRVIKAIIEDGPAKQVLMSPPGTAGTAIASQSITVASGSQNIGIVGSLYSWAGIQNNQEGNRDCYDMINNAMQSDVQVYAGSANAATVYTDVSDSKLRIEGGHAETVIWNSNAGDDMMVDLFECVCRRDVANQTTLDALVAGARFAGSAIANASSVLGTPASVSGVTAWGVSPFQIDGFVHQFKIVKATRVKLEPGGYTTYTMHDSKLRTCHGEELYKDIGIKVAKKGWTRVLLAQCRGMPISATAGAATGSSTLRFLCTRSYTVRNLNHNPEEIVALTKP